MKQMLSVEQSADLIKRGVSANRAHEIKVYDDPVSEWTHKGCPLFTLADLLSLLPKEIEVDFSNADGGIDTEDCYLCTQWCISSYYADNHQWCVFYTPGFQVVGDFCAKELIDALYKCLIWAINNGHVKLD